MSGLENMQEQEVDRLPLEQQRGLLWVPFANRLAQKMTTRGKYPLGYPCGAIVHFTAGHQDQTGPGAIRGGAGNGYAYMFIDKDGKIFQAHPLNEWGYHAGKSYWPGLGEGVSRRLVGIEIACAGKLTEKNGKFYSWWGKEIPADQVAICRHMDNIEAGAYQKYTAAQVESLTNLLLWLKRNNPVVFDFKYVLGHDEVSPGRKSDPGGSLPMSMPDFRSLLIRKYET